MSNKPVLLEYFKEKSKILLHHFELSKQQGASINLGKNRENFVKHFLQIVLPPKLKNIYDGEIIDKNGNRSGQLDLIIIRDDAPCLDYGGSNTYLAEGVFAVIEIKSNLDKAKLVEAKNTLEKVSKLDVNKSSIISGPFLGRPLRIVFSYTGISLDTLFKYILDDNAFDIFDLVCVLDKGVIISKGRLLSIINNNQAVDLNFALIGEASAIGILYYYLVTYGTSFIAGLVNIGGYFEPIEQWGTIKIPNLSF